MEMVFNHPPEEVTAKALQVLQSCTVPQGLLASPTMHDNYQRVWARDSVIAGLAGLVSGNRPVFEAMGHALDTLVQHQASNGQIPSNVLLATREVSYGTLVGRVDATTWWLVGAALHIRQAQHDQNSLLAEQYLHRWQQPMYAALALLNDWEYNQRGLLYTPLGGNWADEYICQGYTLYDNVLRLWALELCADLLTDADLATQAVRVRQLIRANFYHGTAKEHTYHATAYTKAEAKPYLWFQFGPQGYDTRFDMAGNALALLLGLHPEPEKLESWCLALIKDLGHALLPVFYPVIKPEHVEWSLLTSNYLNSFKNKPFHFHNGGAWPVFLGMLSLGLAKNGELDTAQAIKQALHTVLEHSGFGFHEYWSTDSLSPSGVAPLAYTASGWLMVQVATGAQLQDVQWSVLMPHEYHA